MQTNKVSLIAAGFEARDEQARAFLNHVEYVDLETVLRFIAFGWNDPSFIDDVKESMDH